MFFSLPPPCTESGSLTLAVSGRRSCWKSKPETEYDRVRPDIRGAAAGPSDTSRARNESSESRERWDSVGDGGEVAFTGDLRGVYKASREEVVCMGP